MPLATDPLTGTEIDGARFEHLTTRRLYDLLQLRSAVFVVEQDCPYLDPDGRDHEAGAEHLWIDDERGLAATLRLLPDGDDRWSMGRIVTRPDVRSHGLGAALVRAGLGRLRELGCRHVHLGAQAHLEGWYRSLGFEEEGPRYLEDGILHVPMGQELT